MKNWKRITSRNMDDYGRRKGFKGVALRNFRRMLIRIGKSFDRMYSVTMKCPCGCEHESLAVIRDFESSNSTFKGLYDRDRKPSMMCYACHVGIQALREAGIRDKDMVADLMGWNEKKRGATAG